MCTSSLSGNDTQSARENICRTQQASFAHVSPPRDDFYRVPVRVVEILETQGISRLGNPGKRNEFRGKLDFFPEHNK